MQKITYLTEVLPLTEFCEFPVNIDRLNNEIFRMEEKINICEEVLVEWKKKLEDPSMIHSKVEVTNIFSEVVKLHTMIENMYMEWIAMEDSKKQILK